MTSVLGWISQYGYLGLFGMLMFGIAGLPIPDETLLVLSGVLVAQGRLTAWITFLTAFAGSACGISLSYFLGRSVASPLLLRYGSYVHVTPEDLETTHRWFRRMGNWILTFGYFIPGVRHFTALVAGMSKLEFPIFAGFAYLGAVIWISTFLSIGYFVGDRWHSVVSALHRYMLVGALVAAAAAALMWWVRGQRRRD
ncbi:MAG: DedA family protein [Acidobacteriaceae bacterium]|nr:DedA family protein [Acidobacteriaceae bacterium]